MSGEKSIVARMHDAHILLTNVQQPDLKALILPWGYDDPRLVVGQALYDDAKILIDAQKSGYASQFLSTRELYNQAAEAERTFADYVSVARKAFDEEKTINDLRINGPRETYFKEWTDQAYSFYGTALSRPDIMLTLSEYGITPEAFQAHQVTINMLRALSITQQNMIGNAQVATERKNEALKALFKWCAKLINVCRISFRSEPQQLERLGKIVYSPGYKKKSTTTEEPEPEPEQPPHEEISQLVIEGNDTKTPSTRAKGGKRN